MKLLAGDAPRTGANKIALARRSAGDARKRRGRQRALLLASCALVSATLGVTLAPGSAQAQFVCGGSTDGSEPQTGAGATATGSGNNMACGQSANANGSVGGFVNTALDVSPDSSSRNG